MECELVSGNASSRYAGGLEVDSLLLPGVSAGETSSLGSPNLWVQTRSQDGSTGLSMLAAGRALVCMVILRGADQAEVVLCVMFLLSR